jgi:uncharacterized repeat protein (TIGR03987 family)
MQRPTSGDLSGLVADAHGVTGLAAILLLILHAIWATVLLARKDEGAIVNFHRFSVVVRANWLIPYFSGVIMGMRG